MLPRFRLYLLVTTLALSSGGCAYLSTYKSTTDLPATKTVGAATMSHATAVHVDAKQRVILAKPGFACAEPSPDALSAFASSMGLGIALPNQASASFAQALQESSASIGLRTQAITLMRDALYRICEASYNDRLNQPQIMSLLARTQDLTLAVLAVEQLTGAVSAQQVALGGSANAAASAALSTNQQLLQAAKETETSAKAKQTAAEEKEATKRTEVSTRAARIEEIQKLLNPPAGQPAQSAEKQAELKTELDEKQNAQKTAERELELLKQQALSVKEQATQATATREAIEKNFGVALTHAHAAASGFGQFSGQNQPTVKLNDESTKHVAKAVQAIVETVVNRTHVEEACLAIISSDWSGRIEQLRKDIQVLGVDGVKSQKQKELDDSVTTQAFCMEVFAKIIAGKAQSGLSR